MTNIAMSSQVASKVEEKPNIASLPKLRCGSGQRRDKATGFRALTLTTCCRLSVCISRRSMAVPIHCGSSIVAAGGGDGLNEETATK
jgi:hypothetical protein